MTIYVLWGLLLAPGVLWVFGVAAGDVAPPRCWSRRRSARRAAERFAAVERARLDDGDGTALCCDVCGLPVDREDAHWLHDPDCPRRHSAPPRRHVLVETCVCDRPTHPHCCPDCYSIADLARFSAPKQWGDRQ